MLLGPFALIFDMQTTPKSSLCRFLCNFPGYMWKWIRGNIPRYVATRWKTSQNAAEHIPPLQFVLSVFCKDTSNFLSFIADNYSFNQSLRKKMGIAFLRCAIHRFHLAKYLLSEYKKVIKQVNNLMIKLRKNLFQV